MALLLIASVPISAIAAEWYLEDGAIVINATTTGQTVTQGAKTDSDDAPVITQNNPGTPTSNTITINAESGAAANVTINNVNIDVSKTGDYDYEIDGDAAISVTGSGDVTIEMDGTNKAASGYDRAGVEKTGDGTLTLSGKDEDASLDATGGAFGAGIGSMYFKSAKNITVDSLTVTANGGEEAAGFGGGCLGSAQNITIKNSDVTASGGKNAAGVGSGNNAGANGITIIDSKVNATGGNYAAGIGTGSCFYAGAQNISISNSTVTAVGTNGGAGIGTGYGAQKCEGVEISGDSKVDARGGSHSLSSGAAIGTGGSYDSETGIKIEAEEVTPDTSELTAGGCVRLYAPDAEIGKDEPEKIIAVHQAETISPAVDQSGYVYRVVNQDGRDIGYKAERKDGVLTLTVDADFASLVGTVSGIKTLKTWNVKTIVFVTKGATSTFALDNLLEKGNTGDAYALIHDGKDVTFSIGAENTDVSEILEKA